MSATNLAQFDFGPIRTTEGGIDPFEICERLERGHIVWFEDAQFLLAEIDRDILMNLPVSCLDRKNLSFSPQSGTVRGIRGRQHQLAAEEQMRRYSSKAIEFCSRILEPYRDSWRIDLTSFRPLEERARVLPQKQRNDLLHIDAYPKRPMHGARILRFFTNISPSEDRVWLTGDPFHVLAEQAWFQDVVRATARTSRAWWRCWLQEGLHRVGIPFPNRSTYDRAMLRIHDWMKNDSGFREKCRAVVRRFPPGSSWAVFTDAVPHAALEGRFALEQSLAIPLKALLLPEVAPATVMERLVGAATTE